MIQAALIALIRDGETTMFIDPYGAVCFARQLVWGQDALHQWLDGREPVNEFDTDCEAGAVIDYDAQALLWFNENDEVDQPRSQQLLDTLIAEAWPGFEILYADSMCDLQIAAGDSISHASAQRLRVVDDDVDPLEFRSETLDEESPHCEEFDPDDENECFAWVTILDDDQTVQHRLIGEITSDVVRNEDDPLSRLKSLPAYDVPAERNVCEAVLFDVPARRIDLWGRREIRSVAGEMASYWPDWDVQCIDADGYQHQCRISGPAGTPMTSAQALGPLVPILLMTERIDPAMMLGELGKSFKGLMAKLVGLVTVLVCLPFVVFALITGNWKTGGITIGVIVALVVIGFKLVEAKWRRGFAATMRDVGSDLAGPDADQPSVAGPQDPRQRREQLDRLLARAGLPSIADIEPHFESDFSAAIS
ncbi:hypothetical protein [Stieleria mannarensis]|uniref:hypothetical protein n=1 Tax=Stieleria mannarensis TaxID=2755585 RepID=UPI001600A946|nr:hypothetical protein [Rhodopirellula sp. JC639]